MAKPVIGITIGDINGISPEIIIKLFSDDRILKYCAPVLYGSTQVLSFYKNSLNNKRFNYSKLKDWNKLNKKQLNVVNCLPEDPDIKPGEETKEGGEYALMSIDAALKDWKDSKIDAIVTGPINKNLVAKAVGESFKGHTEYITEFCGEEDSMMLLCADSLRVGLATNHLPVQEVSERIKKDLIVKKIELMESALRQDFGINAPKIAVLALNPHAGDNGLIGAEELDQIIPAITQCFRNGTYVFGPFPADGFFGSSDFKKFDGIIAMYHDQGLTPFKAMVFDEGVNYTAGLPLIRTSPDHGTAYDIAGKGIASDRSLRNALFLAVDLVKTRQEQQELQANALVKTKK